MTSIPGTAMPTAPPEKKTDTQPQQTPQETGTVAVQPYNITTIAPSVSPVTPLTTNQPKAPPEAQVVTVQGKNNDTSDTAATTFHAEDEAWYNKLIAWMGFGAAFGVVVAFLGLIHSRLFFLAPLGPTLGTASWYAREFFQKHVKKFDAFPH